MSRDPAMLSREWRALIVVTAGGIVAMACLTPLVLHLPPWVPQEVVDTYARVGGDAATGEPPPINSGVNWMIAALVIPFGGIFAYFRLITRPLVTDCFPEW